MSLTEQPRLPTGNPQRPSSTLLQRIAQITALLAPFLVATPFGQKDRVTEAPVVKWVPDPKLIAQLETLIAKGNLLKPELAAQLKGRLEQYRRGEMDAKTVEQTRKFCGDYMAFLDVIPDLEAAAEMEQSFDRLGKTAEAFAQGSLQSLDDTRALMQSTDEALKQQGARMDAAVNKLSEASAGFENGMQGLLQKLRELFKEEQR